MAGKEIRAGKAFVEIMLRDHLQAGLNKAAAKLRSFSKMTLAVGAGMTGFGASILGPLGAMVNQFSNAGDAVQKMAARTGLSAEAVSELTHAANLSGTDIGALENGVRRMQKTIVDAADGMGSAKDALAALGVTAEQLDGLTPEKQFELLADRISQIEDPTHRAAAAMDIFGKSGTGLLPMMADGAAGIQAMRDQAKALGLTISTDAANSAAQLNDALGTMWGTIKGLTLNIGAALAPTITDLVNRITPVVGAITAFVQRNQRLVTIVAAVGAAFVIAGGALIGIGSAIGLASFALSGLATLAGFASTVLMSIGGIFAAIALPIGIAVAAVTAVAAAFLYFSGTGSKALAWLQDRFGRMVQFVRTISGEIIAAIQAGDYAGAARILWSGIQTAFAAGVGELKSIWGGIVSSATAAWQRIKDAAAGAVAYLGSLWSGLAARAAVVWQKLVAGASTALSAIRTAAAAAWETIIAGASRIPAAIASVFDSITGFAMPSVAPSIDQPDPVTMPAIAAPSIDQPDPLAMPAVTGPSMDQPDSMPAITAPSIDQPDPVAMPAVATDALDGVAGAARSASRSILDHFAAIPGQIIGAISTGVAAIPSLFAAAVGGIGTAVRSIPLMFTAALDLIGRVWQSLGAILPAPLGSVVTAAGDVLRQVAGIFRGAIGLLSGILSPIVSTVAIIFGGAVAAVRNTLAPIAAIVGGMFHNTVAVGGMILRGLVGIVTAVGSSMLSTWSSIVRVMGSAIATLVDVTSRTFAGIIRIGASVASIFAGPFRGLVSSLGSLFASIIDLGGSLLSSVISTASRIGSSILAVLSRPVETLRSLWGSIASTASSAWSGLTSIAGTVASAIGTAFSSIGSFVSTSFMSTLSFVGSAIKSYFGFWMGIYRAIFSSLSAAFASITSGLASIGSFALETFSAIGSAIMSGDFAAAGEIAMTSLQLAFASGMASITTAWTEFATGLTSIFDGVIVSIRQIWNNISSWIGRQILNLVGLIQSTVAKLAAVDPTGLADRLSAAIDFDVDGAIKILEEDRNRFNGGLDTAKQARDDERVTAMQQRIADTEAKLKELRDRRQQSLDDAQAKQESGDGKGFLGGIGDDLKAAFADMPKMFTPPQIEPPTNMAAKMNTVGEGSGQVMGTFSASVAGLLSRSAESIAERTAAATEAMAETLGSIDKELKDRPIFAFEE